MIHYLSLILCFIFLFLAGNGQPVENNHGHDSQEVKECCLQESGKEDAHDCCSQESPEEKDCCGQQTAEESTPDCCTQESGEEKDCCAQESAETKLQDNIPDCCGN